mgnify:FL=1
MVLAGLAVYKYVFAPAQVLPPKETGNENSAQTVQVQTEETGGGGTLTICELRCGDNVCQLESSTELAGVCAETKTDCPQDCK